MAFQYLQVNKIFRRANTLPFEKTGCLIAVCRFPALADDPFIVINNQCKKIPPKNMNVCVALEFGATEYDLDRIYCLLS